MFDSETVKSIQNVEPLDGLDLEKLPQDLTEAYASVVAARLGMIGERVSVPVDLNSTALLLRKLADTYEGVSLFLPRTSLHKNASAFVAASAHAALFKIEQFQYRDGSYQGKIISSQAISSKISATLLFLAGGYHADAAETVKNIDHDEKSSPIENRLIDAISVIASGDGKALKNLAEDTAPIKLLEGEDYFEMAVNVIWKEAILTLIDSAQYLIGMRGDSPLIRLNKLSQKVSQYCRGIESSFEIRLGLPLHGPGHLIKLLYAALESLTESCTVNIPCPRGVDPIEWKAFLKNYAIQRPFLWVNHQNAIKEGFLNSGESFVLTFPTGAGKTTITEIKIAAEILRGKKVVFLAPTRALVSQVVRDLEKATQSVRAEVNRIKILESFGDSIGGDIYVQTPEQCLSFLSYEEDAYSEVGLIVVDECHQISGEQAQISDIKPPSRRSIDAMWSLLALRKIVPDADIVLASAMVKNGPELADWISQITTRPAKAFNLAWKPTRQVRGVVAYELSEIEAIEAKMRQQPEGSKLKKNDLMVSPIGLFCHTQAWNMESTFAKFPLLTNQIPLSTGKFGVTSNRNEVAGALLAAMAAASMRPIVFSQQIKWAGSIAKKGAQALIELGLEPVQLNETEIALFEAAALEIGDPDLVERPVNSLIGVHHGQLLLPERLAMESAFRRPNGLWALVATPTVAQGINLPAEAVIIAGDDRWEDGTGGGGPEVLSVHELLNAAGRAGRAGHYAHGIVLDIPGRVFSIFEGEHSIEFTGVDHVMEIFGSPDQCLEITDPITQILDRLSQGSIDSDVGHYLVRRMGGLNGEELSNLVRGFFGNASIGQDESLINGQVVALQAKLEQFSVEIIENEIPEILVKLAGQLGMSPIVLNDISSKLPEEEEFIQWSFGELLRYQIEFLCSNPKFIHYLIHASDFNKILVPSEDISEWEVQCCDLLRDSVPPWISGINLKDFGEILAAHRPDSSRTKPIDLARKFAINSISGISHGFSILSRLLDIKCSMNSPEFFKSWLRLLPGCIREGLDDPDKLLLFWRLGRLGGRHTRVSCHATFSLKIVGHLQGWEVISSIDARKRLIKKLLENDGGG